MPDVLHLAETRVSAPGDPPRLFDWPSQITPAERKSLLAGGLGWMLDAMDVMLYSLVLAYLIREFSMDTRTAGFLNSLTLVASAIGGLLFGVVADRIGRTRSLMVSILVYSLASAACAFSHSVTQLAVFRFVLGLGMGGEWTAAAALIAETWRPEHRGKALGLMRSAKRLPPSWYGWCCQTLAGARFFWSAFCLRFWCSGFNPACRNQPSGAIAGWSLRIGHRSDACSLAKFCAPDSSQRR